MRRRWASLILPAAVGALLGLAASSPEFVIDLRNWTFWLGARVVAAAFPDLGH